MANENKDAAREAKHGEKMIEVKVRFWTDEIASDAGKVLPKHAWTSGVVRIESNKSHGLTNQNPVPFNSLLELGYAIEKVLLNHGITLHPSRRMRKYVRDVSE
jgi:hypothetical protein